GERFVERRNLIAGSSPKPRLECVEYCMAHFMADNVRALAGIDRSVRRGTVKEVESLAVVIGVKVCSFIEEYLEYCTDIPFRKRHPSGPIVGTPPQRFGRGPVAKFRRSRLIHSGWRSWPWKGKGQGSL